MNIIIQYGIRLELIGIEHVDAVFNAVDQNRKHLSAFLPWVGNMKTSGDMYKYVETCIQLSAEGKEYSYVIQENDEVIGRIGLHHFNQNNRTAAIGYWLIQKAEGRGIITNACREVIKIGFLTYDLNRIEIKAATTNFRSQAIPEKLNFFKEGILRQAELVNGVLLDLYIYSLLRSEWENQVNDV